MSNKQTIFLMTFGEGSELYSNAKPIFKIDPIYKQRIKSKIEGETFAIINAMDDPVSAWHAGALDHTENDTGGYMFVIDSGLIPSLIFEYQVDDLSIENDYEFSVYLANVDRILGHDKPIVTFEVRSAFDRNILIARMSTGEINVDKQMTWRKYGISFKTTITSVLLIMISSGTGFFGNDMAIDDITLRSCSNDHIDLSSEGKFQ